MFKHKLPGAVVLVGLVLQSAGVCLQNSARAVGAAAHARVESGTAAAGGAERRRETFEIVWRTVKENHFDPKFGGVDWDALHAEFAPRVALTANDAELHWLLQQMLNRLGQSHFAIIPPESIPAVPPEETDDEGAGETDDAGDDEDEDAAARRAGGRDLTERLTHGVGVDVRVIDGAVVITRVEPQSPAARRLPLRRGSSAPGASSSPSPSLRSSSTPVEGMASGGMMLKCERPRRLSICCKSVCSSRSVRAEAARGANSSRTASQSTPPNFGSKWFSLTVRQTMSKDSRRRSASAPAAATGGAAATVGASTRGACRAWVTVCRTKSMRKSAPESGVTLDIRLLARGAAVSPARLEPRSARPGEDAWGARATLLKHPPAGACQTKVRAPSL